MVPQDAMMPRAAMLSTISNAWPGTRRLRMTPSNPTAAVRKMPPYGTPRLDIRAVNFGALPFIAIDRRIRPVEYNPALRLENAAVSTTTFMTVHAPSTTNLEKNVTNGLSPALKAWYGRRRASRNSEPT